MTQNIIKNIIGNVASSYQVNLAIEIPNITEKITQTHTFSLSTLGICNIYLNTCHVVGMFFDWPDCFYLGWLGANPKVWQKFGMKLAI